MNSVLFFLVAALALANANYMGGKSIKGGFMGKSGAWRMKYFVASGPEDDCSTVPEETLMGNPMKDGCKKVSFIY
jgi:hypothetical protein